MHPPPYLTSPSTLTDGVSRLTGELPSPTFKSPVGSRTELQTETSASPGPCFLRHSVRRRLQRTTCGTSLSFFPTIVPWNPDRTTPLGLLLPHYLSPFHHQGTWPQRKPKYFFLKSKELRWFQSSYVESGHEVVSLTPKGLVETRTVCTSNRPPVPVPSCGLRPWDESYRPRGDVSSYF